MHRRLSWAGAVAGAFALAACGGDGDTSDDVAPSLPPEVAEALARASDDVAESLEAGNGCVAAAELTELHDAAVVAVDEGRVPGELAEPLLVAVERLETQIECVEVEEPAEEDDDEAPPGKGHDEKKDKKKDKDKGKGDDGNGKAEEGDEDGSGGETSTEEATPTETEGEGR